MKEYDEIIKRLTLKKLEKEKYKHKKERKYVWENEVERDINHFTTNNEMMYYCLYRFEVEFLFYSVFIA